jgi:hypothetical protein
MSYSRKNWSELLQESPIDWLLEWSNPSIRYFTLRDLLGKGEDEVEVIASKKAIPNSPVVSKILAKQNSDGHWEESTSPYFPKYKSSYWQIMILSQLGMDKNDVRIRKACDHIFRFQLDEGGFSCFNLEQVAAGKAESHISRKDGKPYPFERTDSILHEHQYSCLTGNILSALIRMGYGDDQRVKRVLLWLTDVQNEDGGWLCPYWRAHKYDKHGCFYGTICALEAFSEVSKDKLTNGMIDAIKGSSEFLLMHHLYRADHHNSQIINKSWLKLGFPWFYGYNILRGLDIITKVNYAKDERISDAVQILLQKRAADGKWALENTPTGRMQVNLEVKGRPSKWITLIALRVLKSISA